MYIEPEHIARVCVSFALVILFFFYFLERSLTRVSIFFSFVFITFIFRCYRSLFVRHYTYKTGL